MTFNPDFKSLRMLIDALEAQVGCIFVVDNGSAADVSTAFPSDSKADLEFIINTDNLGIAAAQNQGAARALARSDCRFVVLSDQDSFPAPHMVRLLRQALEDYGGGGFGAVLDASRPPFGGTLGPVAAAGPWSVDMRSGERASLVADPTFWSTSRLRRPSESSAATPLPPFEVGFLIASGCLIPAQVLRQIGGMRSNYFIDHVDTEWCLRARAAGFRLLVVPEAHLNHRLGDTVRRLWFLGSHHIAHHSPLRDYYMFRNTLFVLRDVRLAFSWRLRLLKRLILFAVYFIALGSDRLARLRFMSLGLLHGMRSQSGRLNPSGNALDTIPPNTLDPAVASADPLGADVNNT